MRRLLQSPKGIKCGIERESQFVFVQKAASMSGSGGPETESDRREALRSDIGEGKSRCILIKAFFILAMGSLRLGA